jgi:hypothetical protein
MNSDPFFIGYRELFTKANNLKIFYAVNEPSFLLLTFTDREIIKSKATEVSIKNTCRKLEISKKEYRNRCNHLNKTLHLNHLSDYVKVALVFDLISY